MGLTDKNKIGLICGLTVAAYLFVVWAVRKELLFDFWVFNLMWLPYFYFVYLAVKNSYERNPEIDFRRMVKEGFVVYLIAQFIYYTAYYFLFFELDPSLLDLQATIDLERIEQTRGILGEERADEMIKGLGEEVGRMTPGDLLKQFIPSLLPGFIIAAIFALIVKRPGE